MTAAQGGWAAACMAMGFGLSISGLVSASEALRQPPPDGATIFRRTCAGCHGEREGPPVVSLPRPFVYDDDQVRTLAREGRGEMPAFSSGQISDAELGAVAAFLRSGVPR
jgi:mono/diheme cytochrome c family protein